MPRKPKFGKSTDPLSLRPRPASEEAIKKIVEATGRTRAEIAEEIIVLGLPLYIKRNSLPIKVERAA